MGLTGRSYIRISRNKIVSVFLGWIHYLLINDEN